MPPSRPYRFGIFFGAVNALAGLYYGWLAVTSGSAPGAVILGLSSLLSIGTGVGLLRKRIYGLLLMDLTFLMAAVMAVMDWFKPHDDLAYYVFWNVAFFAFMFAVLRYFYKRQYEFI